MKARTKLYYCENMTKNQARDEDRVRKDFRDQEKDGGEEGRYRVYGDALFVRAVCWMKTGPL